MRGDQVSERCCDEHLGPAGHAGAAAAGGGRRQRGCRRAARGPWRQGAFAELFDAFAPTVYGIIRRVLRDPDHSEEVSQEVFVEVWRTAARFDAERGSVAAWLSTLAHRRAVDRVRAEQAHRDRTERHARRDPEVGSADAADAELLAAVERSSTTSAVQSALAELTDLQRQAIELAYYGGYTYPEVAALLDVPLGTVKTRIRDGMIRLRGALEVMA
ncbi:MAG: sigma-70 family RNA polymerase sigma factor [Acidimicrobiales bacterium]